LAKAISPAAFCRACEIAGITSGIENIEITVAPDRPMGAAGVGEHCPAVHRARTACALGCGYWRRTRGGGLCARPIRAPTRCGCVFFGNFAFFVRQEPSTKREPSNLGVASQPSDQDCRHQGRLFRGRRAEEPAQFTTAGRSSSRSNSREFGTRAIDHIVASTPRRGPLQPSNWFGPFPRRSRQCR